jgi:isopentenyl diphosphate isomerase/L-lactate dehydrogenase-like FMN-dependent dehydrogenase
MTGVDDNATRDRNTEAFKLFQIRPRGFVDVTKVDASVEILGQRLPFPILLAPVGHQRAFHEEGELAVARAARAKGSQFILSTHGNTSVRDVAKEHQRPLWFQLYPTSDFDVARQLTRRAEDAGCTLIMLASDSPAGSNRETMRRAPGRSSRECSGCHKPGRSFFADHVLFDGIDCSRVKSILRPITWDLVDQLRSVTKMKLAIKGVMTGEEAADCVRHGVDAIIVSNHGGRQAESFLSTIEVLPEVVSAVAGKVPVLIDGGFRRGTDVFKALAIGAKAICIGRPYLWGLSAFGQPGVERILEIMQAELVMAMTQSGVSSIDKINPSFVRRRQG